MWGHVGGWAGGEDMWRDVGVGCLQGQWLSVSCDYVRTQGVFRKKHSLQGHIA
jgi:hypothetical protein